MFEITTRLCVRNGKQMYCDGDCKNCHSVPKLKYPRIKNKYKRKNWIQQLFNFEPTLIETICETVIPLECYKRMEEMGLTVFDLCMGQTRYDYLDNKEYLHTKCLTCPYYLYYSLRCKENKIN